MKQDLAGTRLLLVNPGIYDDFPARAYPPWGLLYVGNACGRRGAEVKIADLNGEAVAPRVHELLAEFDPTVIGLTGKLGKGAERMRAAVEAAKRHTRAPVAVGGPLVSTFPERDHELWNDVQGLFWGDGEVDFPNWVAAACPRTDVVHSGVAADLDALGLPTWWEGLGEYVSDGEYWPGLNVRSMHVSAARGCTRRCTFCYLNTHYPDRSFRVLSPERLLQGCDELNARWGAEGFYFVDDCVLRPEHASSEALLAALIGRGSAYRFGCDIQIQELADTRFLARMYAAGFRALYVGLEAASPQVRRKLGKGISSRPLYEVIDQALALGFVIRASVGIGWPNESEGEMEETLELVRSLPDLAIDAFRYTPLPGAPLTKYWSRGALSSTTGRITYDPYGDYSEFSSNYSGVPDERLNVLWKALLHLEAERHAAYFRTSVPGP